jgi:hypothetical protein
LGRKGRKKEPKKESKMKKLWAVMLVMVLASGLLTVPKALTQNGSVGLKLPEIQAPSQLSTVVILPAKSERTRVVWQQPQMRAYLETNFLRPDEKRWPSAKKFCLISGEVLLPWEKPLWLGIPDPYEFYPERRARIHNGFKRMAPLRHRHVWLGMAGQYNSSYQIGAPATVVFGPVMKIGPMGESWVAVKYLYSWDELHRQDRIFLIQLKVK